MNKVVFARAFSSDLRRRIRRLVSEDRDDWALRLGEEIEAAATLLAATPYVGVVVRRVDEREVRRLVMPTLPFVLFYAVRDRKVVVLRLFHARQKGARD